VTPDSFIDELAIPGHDVDVNRASEVFICAANPSEMGFQWAQHPFFEHLRVQRSLDQNSGIPEIRSG